MASTKKGSDRASSSSLKRSRRGQMRQVRQMRGRFKSTKLPQISKLSRFSLSFDRGRCGRCGRCFKTFPPTKATDSPKLLQTNSTQHIPVEPCPVPRYGSESLLRRRPGVIISEASLSFLGFGLRIEIPSGVVCSAGEGVSSWRRRHGWRCGQVFT